ncbi:acyl-CoA dehydrogenase C-terminal domain-containing protein [Rhizorhabdus argentea]|uniref:acyl-CoA dehydrogenase C-terminal domain-containing protein n=1 Tax=Rhizorhabdus argentea TaxID=1387174 RepID=UPI0030EE0ACD
MIGEQCKIDQFDKDGTALHQPKVDLADYYAARVLPQAQGLATRIMSGSETMMALELDAF